MPLIKLNPNRSHISSALVEDLRMDSLRNRLLSLFKCTGDFFKEDDFNKSRFRETYSLNISALVSLLRDWNEFRSDCRSAPFCRFRLLYRLRLISWCETADEQIAKLSSLITSSEWLVVSEKLKGKNCHHSKLG
ncbi:hypothetical protein KAB87_004106 [Salmonella enterica]|nr:hypothetical protein [Salmonella enterica]